MSTTVPIERLTSEDWQRFRAIRLSALRQAPDAFGATLQGEEPQTPAFWQGRLANPRAATMIAVDGQVRDAGLVCIATSFDDDSVAGLYAMWVEPFARGQGIGDALVIAAIEAARALGYPRIVLDVGDDNLPAQKLYARHGFVPTGRVFAFDPPREHITEQELEQVL